MGSIAPSVALALDLGVVVVVVAHARRRWRVVDKRAVDVVVDVARREFVVVARRHDAAVATDALVVGVIARMVDRTPRGVGERARE